MIKTVTILTCDKCKKEKLELSPSPTQPYIEAINLGWRIDNDNILSCPKCILNVKIEKEFLANMTGKKKNK